MHIRTQWPSLSNLALQPRGQWPSMSTDFLCLAVAVIWSRLLNLSSTAGRPKGISYDNLYEKLSQLESVMSVHSLKVWSITSNEANACVHLAVGKKLDYYHLSLINIDWLVSRYSALITLQYLLPGTYYLVLTTWYLLPATHYLVLTTWYSLQTPYYTVLTTWYSLPATHYLVLTTWYLLPGTHYLLLTTWYLLPGTYYLVLTTCYSLPSTYSVVLTTDSLLPGTYRVTLTVW